MKGIQTTSILTALAFMALPIVARAQDTAEAAPVKNIQMVSVRASLSKGIDAKKVKQGDAVTAKLQDDVKIPGSVDLPKNTVLLGHVDQVQPSENKGDSSVQVTFDKAQLKNGQQLAIKATIMQISAPISALRNQEGASPGEPAAMPSSPVSSSGGASGGGMQPPQSTPRPAPSSMPSVAPDSSQPSSQQTAIAGVQLQSDIHQSNSAVFTAKKKNVHLDDGTQLQMAIAVIPPNTQMQ